MEEKHKEGMWEGALGFHDLSGWAALPASPRVHQPEALESFQLRVYFKWTLHFIGLSTADLYVINSNSSLFPLPCSQQVELKYPTL